MGSLYFHWAVEEPQDNRKGAELHHRVVTHLLAFAPCGIFVLGEVRDRPPCGQTRPPVARSLAALDIYASANRSKIALEGFRPKAT